jgi:hypothetical protein
VKKGRNRAVARSARKACADETKRRNKMSLAIERLLETIAFVLIVASFIAIWFITPANAYTCYSWKDSWGRTFYTCS